MGQQKKKIIRQYHATAYEQLAIEYLENLGYQVEIIPVVRIERRKTPDILIGSVEWEIKTPIGNASRTIENMLRLGSRQSQNIILDIRFTKRLDEKCIAEVKRYLTRDKRIRQIMIIPKEGERMLLQS